MSNKVLIGVLIAVIIIVIIIISLVSSSFKDDGTRYQKTVPGMVTVETKKDAEKSYADNIERAKRINSKYTSSSYNIYYLSLDENQRTEIDNLCDDVLDLFNYRKDEEMYDKHIEPYYKDSLFPDVSYLSKYLDEKFPHKGSYLIHSYELGIAYLYIPIYDNSDGNEKEVMTLRVNINEVGGYKIFFGKLVDDYRFNNSFETDDYRIETKYGIRYDGYCSIILRIINKKNKEVEVRFDGTTFEEMIGKNGWVGKALDNNVTTVPANGETRYELFLQDYKFDINTIKLKVLYDSKEYNHIMYVNYASENEDFD